MLHFIEIICYLCIFKHVMINYLLYICNLLKLRPVMYIHCVLLYILIKNIKCQVFMISNELNFKLLQTGIQ